MSTPTDTTTPPISPFPENKRLIGAFWTKTSNRGGKFLSGTLSLKNVNGTEDKVDVLLLKVENRRSDKAPDYELLLTHDELARRLKVGVQQEGRPTDGSFVL